MKAERIYLAVDLGAGSGRVLAGIYDGQKLSLNEINRFPSEAFKDQDGWHWNFDALLSHIKKGIALAVEEFGDRVVSLGVDTWGVDYGLLDQEGKLIAQPFQYRDSRTEGMMEQAFKRMSKEEIYERTGIQCLFFNTLFQLLAEKKSAKASLEKASSLLFMPDLVNYYLTGKQVNEISIASTGQLLNAGTQDWDHELLERMGLPGSVFGKLVRAGESLGTLTPEVVAETGGTGIKVIAVGSHDTASAVAGVPSTDEEPVFLSSGTWSLFGRELKQPVLTGDSFVAGFSNEGGVLGTTRFLKNISGMWLLQECKKSWDNQGPEISYADMVAMAEGSQPGLAVIDPDAPEFMAPEDMPTAIAGYCRKTRQEVPQSPGQFTRVILESLALKYAEVKRLLENVTGQPVHRIHIVGGGSQNRFMNQLAANATGCEIVAGPVEATSLGNILMQMIAGGELKSLQEGRNLIVRSFSVESYHPVKTDGVSTP